MSPGHEQAWRDLVSRRVAEAGAGLSAVQVSSAIDAAAPNAKALSVLARALEPGPGALLVGAPPVIGKLVAELRARGLELARAHLCPLRAGAPQAHGF